MTGEKQYYYLIYKPFNVLSQFTKEVSTHVTLKDCFPKLPTNIYPVGRLDADSEGLLIITNDNYLKNRVLSPEHKIQKTYLAQVDGVAAQEALEKLKSGVTIRIKKKEHFVKAFAIERIKEEPDLPIRTPPIRVRKLIPTSWVRITITEGKNRQIRRMFARVDLPVLRLVRERIGNITMDKVIDKPCIELTKEEIYNLTGLKKQPHSK